MIGRVWYVRITGGLAHIFALTEPACGEPSGPEQWAKAPDTAPRCPGCLDRRSRAR